MSDITVPEKYAEWAYEYREGYAVGSKQEDRWRVRYNPISHTSQNAEPRRAAWEAGKRAGQKWRAKAK